MRLAPEIRGLGVARRLLAALERAARERKTCAIRLDAHESLTVAIRFHGASGYRETARSNDDFHAHHRFGKALTIHKPTSDR